MVKPEQIKAYDDMSVDILAPIKEELLIDIARRIAKAGTVTDTAAYQIYRAAALRASKAELSNILGKHKKSIVDEVSRIYDSAANAAYGGQGSIKQTVDAYKSIATSSLLELIAQNLAAPVPNGKVLPLQDAYRATMDYAFRQVITGATDYTTALRRATQQLAKRGIRELPRKNGKSVSIEHAARGYIMNQLGLMNREITQRNHNELEHDGWEISAHRGSAPDHEPIQGRQYPDAIYQKLNGRFDGNYQPNDPNVLERPIGQLGCRHWAFSIKLGVNSAQYTEEQLNAFTNDNAQGITFDGKHYTRYEADQEQSALEAKIRMGKSNCMLHEGLGDSVKLRNERISLGRLREEYVRFSQAAELPLRNERLQPAGFGRGEATKARAVYAPKNFVGYEQLKYIGDVSDAHRINIEQEASLLPKHIRESVEKNLSGITVEESKSGSFFNPKTKTITFTPILRQGGVIHEYAHALEDVLDLYNNPQFIKIRNKGFENYSPNAIIEYNIMNKPIYFVAHPKLISLYQGRLYEKFGVFDGKKVIFDGMREYFSEGLRAYYFDTNRLKTLDPDLFTYLEELLK